MTTTTTTTKYCVLFFHLLLLSASQCRGGGSWTLLQKSIGISAMHMQLLHNDRVVIYDRTDFGPSNISLPAGTRCKLGPARQLDCTAHSVEYDAATNAVRPLTVRTEFWCSSGAVSPDGRLFQAGGFGSGISVVRVFAPCTGCDWVEQLQGLAAPRWYATSQALPDGRQVVVGGRGQFNYEFVPKKSPLSSSGELYGMGFLEETFEGVAENNLYPFVLLNVDGNLFVFANNRAVLLDYRSGVVVRRYPVMPGGDPRSYPSTGSAVLLPLRKKNRAVPGGGDLFEPEVLVCGGAPRGSFQLALKGIFRGALRTCGRIKIADASPQWAMEPMPLPRVMGDMLLLPTGDVLIINGAAAGTASWELGRQPVLHPVIYSPDNNPGNRFKILSPARIPRMYHSCAVLLRDGRVLVGGSNPHEFYNFTGVMYPTELSLEAFSPPYMDPALSGLRPIVLAPGSQARIRYRQRFEVLFSVPSGKLVGNKVAVTLLAPSFTTHSFAMNQRLLVINDGRVPIRGRVGFGVRVTAPGSRNLAPPGYYILHVVHAGIPSEGVWVHIS